MYHHEFVNILDNIKATLADERAGIQTRQAMAVLQIDNALRIMAQERRLLCIGRVEPQSREIVIVESK